MASCTFEQWLQQAQVPLHTLTDSQTHLLRAAFDFLQQSGSDYFSRRLLSHFLLHCQAKLPVAWIARLLDFSRPTLSKQQGLPAKQLIQAAHHRLAGRPYGKLLPRFAGPIAQFLCNHPQASRYDLLDFIEQTLHVRVSTVALHRYLKKYGLDRQSLAATQEPVNTPPAEAPAVSATVTPVADRVAPRPEGTPPTTRDSSSPWVGEHPEVNVTLRACRYPGRLQRWKRLESGLFVPYQEEGVCVGASAKEIRLAETTTVLRGESEEQAIRTIVCRELVGGPKKDRWHPLYTTCVGEPREALQIYRQRQHQEQGYRVGVHDLGVNAIPCGYDKESPDRQRPRFHRGPLQMLGWLVLLVYNACKDLCGWLSSDYADAHVSTLRRHFFDRPGQLYLTPTALIVYLDPFSGQEELIPLIDEINREEHRIPWLNQ